MGQTIIDRIMQGSSDANIRFHELRVALKTLGFTERIRGSHHIVTHPDVVEILNLQPRGSFAKPYQVKQVRKILIQYKLVMRPE